MSFPPSTVLAEKPISISDEKEMDKFLADNLKSGLLPPELTSPRDVTGAPLLYIMRHGRTALDVAHRSDGWLDLPLSDDGRREIVKVLSDYLKHARITCIYVAPLKRSMETGHILQSGIASKPDIEIAPEAITWNLGSLAGNPKQPNKSIVKDLLENPDKSAPDGESYGKFKERFDGWMEKQKKDAQRKGPFLIVLSGSNCRRISEKLFNDRSALDIDESGLFVMYFEYGKWTAEVVCGHRDKEDLERDPEAS
jgi:broad specificity phosphatase PhoE